MFSTVLLISLLIAPTFTNAFEHWIYIIHKWGFAGFIQQIPAVASIHWEKNLGGALILWGFFFFSFFWLLDPYQITKKKEVVKLT